MYLGTIPVIFKLEYWVQQNWGLPFLSHIFHLFKTHQVNSYLCSMFIVCTVYSNSFYGIKKVYCLLTYFSHFFSLVTWPSTTF